jgi:hypothetical protein
MNYETDEYLPVTDMLPNSLGTLLTPAEAPASENFKSAAKLGALAGLAAVNILARSASARQAEQNGRPYTNEPISSVVAQGALVAGTLGAFKELSIAVQKRRSKH